MKPNVCFLIRNKPFTKLYTFIAIQDEQIRKSLIKVQETIDIPVIDLIFNHLRDNGSL